MRKLAKWILNPENRCVVEVLDAHDALGDCLMTLALIEKVAGVD